jgi:hypothetical protein
MSRYQPGVDLLDELTTLVLAPNPSPMTLEGTNTYLLGAPGSGEVDRRRPRPGPHAPAAVEGAVRGSATRRSSRSS